VPGWTKPALAIGGLLALLVGGVVGLHALFQEDSAWAPAVQAMSTVVLVAITGCYAYLTFRLVEAQRSAPRRAAWEDALRELSRFIAQNNEAVWNATALFPVDTESAPADLMKPLDGRDAMRALRNGLLERTGLVPKTTAGEVLAAAARVLEAEEELHALGATLTEEMVAGSERDPPAFTWAGARAAHEAADDPDRSEPWADMLEGRRMKAAEESLNELSHALDRELTAIEK
jgi:hypothetical protein